LVKRKKEKRRSNILVNHKRSAGVILNHKKKRKRSLMGY